jgi:amino acid transporter
MKNIKIRLIIAVLAIILPMSVVSARTTTAKSLVETIDEPTQKMLGETGLNDFTLVQIIVAIIQVALSLLGIIFLIIIVFAGYSWMTAAGNEEAVKKAQDMIKRAIIGLVIVLMAYAITYFIFNQLPFSGGGGIGTGNNSIPRGGATP